jgi:hypothetical protein
MTDVKELISKVASLAANQALKILGLEEGPDTSMLAKIQETTQNEKMVKDLTEKLTREYASLDAAARDKWLTDYKGYMGLESVGYSGPITDENKLYSAHQKAMGNADAKLKEHFELKEEIWVPKGAGTPPVVGAPASAPGEPQANPTPPPAPGEAPGPVPASIHIEAAETAVGKLYEIVGKDPASKNMVSTAGIAELIDQIVAEGGRETVAKQIKDIIAGKEQAPAGEISGLLNIIRVVEASTKEVDNVDVKADTKQNKGEVSGFSSNEGAKQGKPGVFPKVDGMVSTEKGGDESISTKKDNTLKMDKTKAFDAEVQKVARSRGITCENIKMASVVTADLKQNQKAGEVTGGSDNANAKQGKPGVFPKVDGQVSKESWGDSNISTKKDNTLKTDKAKAFDSEVEKVARSRGLTTEKGKIV